MCVGMRRSAPTLVAARVESFLELVNVVTVPNEKVPLRVAKSTMLALGRRHERAETHRVVDVHGRVHVHVNKVVEQRVGARHLPGRQDAVRLQNALDCRDVVSSLDLGERSPCSSVNRTATVSCEACLSYHSRRILTLAGLHDPPYLAAEFSNAMPLSPASAKPESMANFSKCLKCGIPKADAPSSIARENETCASFMMTERVGSEATEGSCAPAEHRLASRRYV